MVWDRGKGGLRMGVVSAYGCGCKMCGSQFHETPEPGPSDLQLARKHGSLLHFGNLPIQQCMP